MCAQAVTVATVPQYLIAYSSMLIETRQYLFSGLNYWTGLLDWTTGLRFFLFQVRFV